MMTCVEEMILVIFGLLLIGHMIFDFFIRLDDGKFKDKVEDLLLSLMSTSSFTASTVDELLKEKENAVKAKNKKKPPTKTKNKKTKKKD